MREAVQALKPVLVATGMAVLGVMLPFVAAAADYPSRPEVRSFIDSLAGRHGFDPQALENTFSRVRRSDEAIRLMTPPPAGSRRSWRSYRARFIDDARITAGLRFWREHEDTIRRASERFGVPEEIIVSIIGVETVFGKVTGDYRVIDVLTTLAFDYPRRADFFREELEHYLLLTRQEGLSPFSIRGSYAGAIGLPQFMPGSIRRWAIDFDGDGRIDLRESAADAIGSVANFLSAHGWEPGGTIRYPARIADPARIAPLIESGIMPTLTIDALETHGVSSPAPIGRQTLLALIDLPNGEQPAEYWLGARNFYVITRYNRSNFYASAVTDLSQALRAGRGR
jgi:membrane-bound lytic murein transglycosylase B